MGNLGIIFANMGVVDCFGQDLHYGWKVYFYNFARDFVWIISFEDLPVNATRWLVSNAVITHGMSDSSAMLKLVLLRGIILIRNIFPVGSFQYIYDYICILLWPRKTWAEHVMLRAFTIRNVA